MMERQRGRRTKSQVWFQCIASISVSIASSNVVEKGLAHKSELSVIEDARHKTTIDLQGISGESREMAMRTNIIRRMLG